MNKPKRKKQPGINFKEGDKVTATNAKGELLRGIVVKVYPHGDIKFALQDDDGRAVLRNGRLATYNCFAKEARRLQE